MYHKLTIMLNLVASTVLAQSYDGASKNLSVETSHLYHVQVAIGNGDLELCCNGLPVPPNLNDEYLEVLLDQVREGDLVLFELGDANAPPWFIDKLFDAIKSFRQKKVALRFSSPSEKVRNIFWWVSPYNLPRDHADTIYYWNHVRLGRGDEGFERALKILGELPNDEKDVHFSIGEYRALGHANLEIPYLKREDDLQRVLKAKHITFRRLNVAPAR